MSLFAPSGTDTRAAIVGEEITREQPIISPPSSLTGKQRIADPVLPAEGTPSIRTAPAKVTGFRIPSTPKPARTGTCRILWLARLRNEQQAY